MVIKEPAGKFCKKEGGKRRGGDGERGGWGERGKQELFSLSPCPLVSLSPYLLVSLSPLSPCPLVPLSPCLPLPHSPIPTAQLNRYFADGTSFQRYLSAQLLARHSLDASAPLDQWELLVPMLWA
jgi:hypothetical protein